MDFINELRAYWKYALIVIGIVFAFIVIIMYGATH